jgi:hypothetical protein
MRTLHRLSAFTLVATFLEPSVTPILVAQVNNLRHKIFVIICPSEISMLSFKLGTYFSGE